MVKKTSTILSEQLAALLASSTDIIGAAVVGVDGLVYASDLPKTHTNEDITGAVAAAIVALGLRTVSQLDQGKLTRVLIQGDKGNIVVTVVNKQVVFVGLMPGDAKLGMAFAEARSISEKLAVTLQNLA